MSVLLAFDRYRVAALAAGVDVTASLRGIARTQVESHFEDHGLEVHEDLIDYFSVIGHIKGRHLIFPDTLALDLQSATEHRAELFGPLSDNALTENAEGPDGEAILADDYFPISEGKPTLLVNLKSGAVLKSWWDEPGLRPAHRSIAEWLQSLAERLVSDEGFASRFRFANEPGRAFRVTSTPLLDDDELRKRALQQYRPDLIGQFERLVVRYLPVDGSAESVAFARDRAERLADFIAGDHMPRDRITTHQDMPNERGGGRIGRHSLWVDGYYVDEEDKGGE